MEILEALTRQFHALEQTGENLEIAQQVLAVKATHGQSDDIIARSGHFFHFHASLGTHKQDIGLGMTATQLVGNGQGREDMSSRTASTDEHIQLFLISRHF